MTSLSKTEEGIAWIKRFSVDDQVLVIELLNSLTLVSYIEFVDNLRNLIIDIIDKNFDGSIVC